MANAFSKLISAGLSLNLQIAGEKVVYRRGDQSVSLTAKRRRIQNTTDREPGFVLQSEQDGWRIARAELLLSGEPIEPRLGDLIEWTDAGRVKTYLVSSPDDLSRCWRWSDAGETHFYVFTKLSGKESA